MCIPHLPNPNAQTAYLTCVRLSVARTVMHNAVDLVMPGKQAEGLGRVMLTRIGTIPEGICQIARLGW